jgi:hypothetical protein
MKISMKSFVFAAAVLLFSMSNSFAAVDMYLKIIDASGKSQIVQVKCPDGSCAMTVSGLAPGKCTILLCDQQGRLMKAKEKANRCKCTCNITYYSSDVKSPRDLATGQASGKIASTTTTEVSSASAPRDVATGHASGKRQHVPIMISKVVDDTERTFVASGDVDGDSITFQKIEWTWSDGSKSAMDDWSTN